MRTVLNWLPPPERLWERPWRVQEEHRVQARLVQSGGNCDPEGTRPDVPLLDQLQPSHGARALRRLGRVLLPRQRPAPAEPRHQDTCPR